jgi:hypothetical protein
VTKATAIVPPEWFWARVQVGAPDDCWPWLGSVFPSNGYGRLPATYGRRLAHRAAFRIANGHDAPDFVLHSCDNRLCCNPAHLRNGTAAENAADAVARGRMSPRRGELNTRARLTEAAVLEIRTSADPNRKLADRFGVTTRTVRNARNGRSWAHLPNPRIRSST